MGTKNSPGQFDCYENALPDEPIFILLARDPHAPELVENWALVREADITEGNRPESDRAMVEEARDCAVDMRKWRRANDGKWRARSEKCPSCNSPNPELHPSIQWEGEVRRCSDDWHGIKS